MLCFAAGEDALINLKTIHSFSLMKNMSKKIVMFFLVQIVSKSDVYRTGVRIDLFTIFV